MVCAATFTGAASKAPEETGGGKADGPLTGDELRYFNETFFNGEGFNIRNQFLTSTYERAEDVDLFQLFYNGTGLPADTDGAERRAVCRTGAFDEDPGVDLTKCPAADMSTVLTQNANLPLSATNRVGLEDFIYLPDYDAYYHFHGDTNYWGDVDIVSGEREGDLLRLYYEDTFIPDGWKCVTLREAPNGEYWFSSNLLCERPAVPTAYPAGEPWMTIPLEDLTPYEPQVMEVMTPRSGDTAEVLDSWMVYDQTFQLCRAADGSCYAALGEGPEQKPFLTLPENGAAMEDFYDLLGHYGVVITYRAPKDGEYFTTFNDYYTVDGSGAPCLLARAYGESVIKTDLDGDGIWELASAGIHDVQIFFQRDGQLYEADVLPLLAERWRDPVSFYPTYWDKYGRSLYLNAEVPFPDAVLPAEFGGGQATGTAVRQVYFDGENLRLYRDDNQPVTDHVMEGVQAPEDVLEAARTEVHNRYEYARTHTGVTGGDGEMWDTPAEYDDWRLEITGGPWTETLGGQTFEIWNINYEFHTTTPERVILAGGSYLTEDAWHCNTYPGCTYLYFQLMEDGSRRYLYSAMENDCAPGTEMFRTDMAYTLDGMGIVPLSDLEGEVLADMILMNEASFLNNMAEREDGEIVIDRLRSYLISTYGSALDGLIEINIAFSGSSSGWSHEELYQYYARRFDNISDLTEGGAALWARLTDQAAAPESSLLPTLEDIRALAPAEVAEAVFQLGQTNLAAYLREPALYDGWRVSGLTRETGFSTYGLNLPVYSAWFELHPSQPDKVVLAGGMDFTEDGWVKGLMSASPYLLFLLEDGHYTLLESDIPDDLSTDSPGFQAEIAWALLENQLVRPSQIDAETLLTMLNIQSLNLLGT